MSFPKDLNLSSNKPIAISSKPSINRYRSDNNFYQSGDVVKIEIPTGRQGQYLYTRDSFIEFRIKVNQTNTAVANSATYIDGSVYSLYSRRRILHGSSVVEDNENSYRINGDIVSSLSKYDHNQKTLKNNTLHNPHFLDNLDNHPIYVKKNKISN